MKIKRIILKIDIKGPNLVKGINYEGLRVLGNPDFFIKNYYKEGADEIIYQDCVASLYNKSYILELIKKFSSKIYIPDIVGGGIRNLNDIELILRNGADKIFLNSAAIKSPKLIDDAVKRFGSSTYYAVKNTGFRPRPFRSNGTYGKYNSLDDKIDDLHYYTTFIKFGIGRATYDSSQEIRNRHINRDEAKLLVKNMMENFLTCI